ncbi:class I SAM-dependent methyltransferase [Microbacterium dauci]|uniref:Class I SAM-dependent methyltransferase n=1 Tax=Microbacterium dauci TaxID=3048008 RepID=A0ABT6ZDX0_9MICO|nr:class I SAM-dependent methyltransferase [Microbacterium sp. LX3-4]MDJ1114118.1 class I SAM-dependent methyltransferase [Microbacterium sp. LX3-4]
MADAYAAALPDAAYEAPEDLALIERFLATTPRDARILDAGCGTGRMIDLIISARPDAMVLGVDASAAMLAHARVRHPRFDFITGELATLPFPDAVVDGILAWYSVIHTAPAELGEVIAELARVLAPGGHLLLGFQAGEGVRELTHAYGHDVDLRAYLHSAAAVGALAVEAGLQIVEATERLPRSTETHPQGFVLARR